MAVSVRIGTAILARRTTALLALIVARP